MYLNVDEIVTKTEILSLAYPEICRRFSLPYQTFENRTLWALHIATPSQRAKHGVLVVAGVHAREWGTCDIVIHFLEQLLESYELGTALTYGNKTFTSSQVRNGLDGIELFVLPCANPDGRHYSFQAGDDESGFPKNMWRKNRRDNGPAQCRGVDLNRNLDWLWDFNTAIHPQAYATSSQYNWCQGTVAVSDNPCHGTYHGPTPFSEPETRNIKFLLDEYPHIRFYADVHGTKGIVLTPWGDDEIQNSDPGMNFLNTDYDGLRGLTDGITSTHPYCQTITPNPAGVAYKEYMHAVDQARFETYGSLQRDAVNAVRGKAYETAPEFTGLYGITGGTIDYAYGRHIEDPALSKIDSYLYEYGINTGFQPPYESSPGPSDMIHVIREVSAGLTELVVHADRVPIVTVEPSLLDFGRVRMGTTAGIAASIRNDGPGPLEVGPAAVVSAAATPFSVAGGGTFTLNSGQTHIFTIQCSPNATGQFRAHLSIRFTKPGETVEDVSMIPCKAEVCSVSETACVAPVFSSPGLLGCLLAILTIPPLIAALSLFIWIPGVYCLIRKLIFILQHCGSGNTDPCITLLKNRWGYR